MSRKRYTPEQIISMLREAEVALAQGQSIGQASLPTLQLRPHGRRCTARGETRSATPFVSRDSHPLPFTSSPGAPS